MAASAMQGQGKRAWLDVPELGRLSVPIVEPRDRGSCAVRVCTKGYGGRTARHADPEYMRMWMGHFERLGVASVVLYALEPLEEYTHTLLRSFAPRLSVRTWGDVHYTSDEYAQESASRDGQINQDMNAALDFCERESVGAFDWLINLDIDEMLFVGAGSRALLNDDGAISRSLCEQLLHDAPYSELRLPSIQHRKNQCYHDSPSGSNPPCDEQMALAREAARNDTLRSLLEDGSHPELGWKDIWRLDENGRGVPDAHRSGVRRGLLVSPDVAYIRHLGSSKQPQQGTGRCDEPQPPACHPSAGVSAWHVLQAGGSFVGYGELDKQTLRSSAAAIQ